MHLLPTTGPPIQLPSQGATVNAYPVAAGLNQISMTGHTSTFTSDPYTYSPGVWYTFWNSAHTETDSFSMQSVTGLNTPHDQQYTRTLQAAPAYGSAIAGYWNASYGANAQNEPTVLNVQMFCGSASITAAESCCPPDPSVLFALNQVLQLEQTILNALAQHYSYSKGAAHVGLVGSGSLVVSDIVGVLVDITAQPPTRVQPGNPAYIWDMGWLSTLTGDGMIEEKRLTRSHQIWMPVTAAAATTIGYYLNPGVVATITLLNPA
jgi:hypothetical protein